MSDIKLAFGTASQPITCSLAPGGTGLANGNSRESTAINNTVDLFLDALLYLAIKVGTVANERVIKVYFYGSEDGTNYTYNATGSDASITLTAPVNLRGPFLIQCPTSSVTYKVVVSVAQFFDGIMPAKWGIVITNSSGASLDTTEGNHTKEYRGVYQTVV